MGIFIAGMAAGGALRPIVGSILRNLSLVEASEPLPLDLVLWNTMTEQFRVLDRTGRGPTIVYLGDSITSRTNVDEVITFEGGRVVNRSVSGDTTVGMVGRIRESFPENVEVCFVQIGVNDLGRRTPAASVSD